MTPFAAVLLAGGRSRRMGRDKALLPLPDACLLWERQFAVLQGVEPAELFVSGERRREFPGWVRCLADETPGQGPLGGIVTALHAARVYAHLLVLAVDLPNMTAGYLRSLVAQAEPGSGCVPWHPEGEHAGFYEPLAAVYPGECLSIAKDYLQDGGRAMQGFLKQAGSLIRPVLIRPPERRLFENWNTPLDQREAKAAGATF